NGRPHLERRRGDANRVAGSGALPPDVQLPRRPRRPVSALPAGESLAQRAGGLCDGGQAASRARGSSEVKGSTAPARWPVYEDPEEHERLLSRAWGRLERAPQVT